MPGIDYEKARRMLEICFADAEFAFREALEGRILARMQDKKVNIRLPSVGQGALAASCG